MDKKTLADLNAEYNNLRMKNLDMAHLIKQNDRQMKALSVIIKANIPQETPVPPTH